MTSFTQKIPAALFIAAALIASWALLGMFRSNDTVQAAAASDTGIASASERVAFWQDRVHPNDGDYLNRTALAVAMVDLARETEDFELYQGAEVQVTRALESNPSWNQAKAVLAGIQLASHRFDDALALASEAFAADPELVTAVGVMGDAQLELGNYEEAERSYALLFQLADTPSVRVRLANLAWHQGDPDLALVHAETALRGAQAQRLSDADITIYQLQLANYRFKIGDVKGASDLAQLALQAAPDFAPAVEISGRIAAAQGDLDLALALYQRAVALAPDADHLALVGDVYLAMGKAELAEASYVLADKAAAQLDGPAHYRVLASYYSDHKRNLDTAVDLALKDLESRRDVYSLDMAMWALHQAGRNAEAAQLSAELGDHPLLDSSVLYHRGMVALHASDTAQARSLLKAALDLNPSFSLLQSPFARAALDGLS